VNPVVEQNAGPPLEDGDVRLWLADVRFLAVRRQELESVLSEEERERADRYRGDALRDRFALVRGALRCLIGRHLARPPAELALVAGEFGKPLIPGSDLFFNVSHARHLALMGFARGRRIGVDLAWLDEPVDTAAVARWLPDLPAGADRPACWRAWTEEEARRKTAGVGFMAPIPDEARNWTARPLPVPAGFVATLVAEGDLPRTVSVLDLDPGVGSSAALPRC
jgi:4'-phosphopantetheinyl transferase